MKSMEDYISEVYEKYESIEKNNITYKKVKMKYHNPLPALCGIAACLIMIVICGGLFTDNSNNISNPNKENIHIATEEKDGMNTVFIEYLYLDGNLENVNKKLISKSDCIIITDGASIGNYNFNINNGEVLITTNGLLNVNTVLKGDMLIKNKSISYYMISGIISLVELEKYTGIDWKDWEIKNLGSVIPEEEKSTTYFKQIPEKYCEIEEGKQYLVFLKYDEEKDRYNIWDYAYGIMEYDPITKMVKNIDTGEFEEFDWDLINEK